MTAPWLSIVGIGEDGPAGLTPAARALIEAAELLIGGRRHLAMLPEDGRPRLHWETPFRPFVDRVAAMKGRRVCVLASGDPMCFGVGASFCRRVPMEEMVILPAPSAFALAAARLGWPLHTVTTLTLHGRPLDLLNAEIRPGARLLILAHDAATPATVAARLTAAGHGDSRISVLEHMGGPRERRIDGIAARWAAPPGADLNTIAVECVAGPDAVLRPRVPGLPDAAFANDGQLTKSEIRAVTLAALAPGPRQRLWDVGAGCGSVAIEWLRADPLAEAVAVETRPDRRTLIAQNAAALGVPRLAVVAGTAPASLAGLAPPDAVFIGGGITTPGLVERCWQALRPGGRLVANTVTLEGEQAVFAHAGRHGGALRRLAVARAEPVGPFRGWRPLMPVTQWHADKPRESAG